MSAITAEPILDWQAANRACLRAEFSLLAARIATAMDAAPRTAIDDAVEALGVARSQLPAAAAVDAIADGFGLSAFERDLLLLAAGVEADSRLAAACGTVTFDAAAAILPDARWEALAPAAPLRRWQLLTLAPGPLASAAIRTDERVLFHILGVDSIDLRLAAMITGHAAGDLVAAEHRSTAAAIAADWRPTEAGWPVVELTGDDARAKEDVAALVAVELDWRLGILRGEYVPAHPPERRLLATLWTRESILSGAALLITDDGREHTSAVADLAELLAAPTFVAAPASVDLRRPWESRRVERPSEGERRRLWRRALGTPEAPDSLADALAGRFAVGAREIAGAAPDASAARSRGGDPLAAVRERLRAAAGHRTSTLTRTVEPVATCSDLVLPEPARATLGEIAAQVRNRATVYEEWGFGARGARGLGITALFAGESGTGKTMAAEVLARELALELHVVDLSAVVSKYIGETEKNLRAVFDAAEDGAILLFDEADALFGRRTEVKDSHDRYANLEVSYLLQRMEDYRGLAILTTNAKAALDHAFRRRIRFVVSFPFPDAALREQIWRRVFPPGTPLGRLDWTRLASLDLSGGSIRSIAVNAAFLAADAGGPVRMPDIRAAIRQELAKLERPQTGRRGGW